MKYHFKITRGLLRSIRLDLTRAHPFAYERVGFISANFATDGDNIFVLACDYRPVADEDYLHDDSVGAMMGPEAIRKALQWSFKEKVGMFHVHTHCGNSIPSFSGVDLREQAKFVPNFFQLVPQRPHGAIVLSDTHAYGHVWLAADEPYEVITDFVEVGSPLNKWNAI